jgi:hypothetical protein
MQWLRPSQMLVFRSIKRSVPSQETVRSRRADFDVVISRSEIPPRISNMIYSPLIYLHGRAPLSYSLEDLLALREHLGPGEGTIFADADRGNPAFDAAFRRFVADLLPNCSLVPIPKDDVLYTRQILHDLSDVQFSRSTDGGHAYPRLEGVKLNGC